MEDVYSLHPFFFDCPATLTDESPTCLPARIAVQMELALGWGEGGDAASTAPLGRTAMSDPTDVASGAEADDAAAASTVERDTLHFFGVYDGHGGVEAANHCAAKLHLHLSAALTAVGSGAQLEPLPQLSPSSSMSNTVDDAHLHLEAVCEAAPGAAAAAASMSSSPPDVLHASPGRFPAPEVLAACPQSTADAEAPSGAHTHGGAEAGPAASSPLGGEGDGGPAASASARGASVSACAALGHGGVPGSNGSSAAPGSESGGGSESVGCVVGCALRRALRHAFLKTDAEFAEDNVVSASMVGTTAVVALLGTKKMWVANCGDSRAVLCRGGRVVQLTDDHKPEREDEAARVERAGGQVLYWNGHRVMGVLAMSRAIGDHGLRPYVIPEPEITVVPRHDDDDFLLLASDGLWDVMANQEATSLAIRCMTRAWEKGASRKAAVRIAASVLTKAAVDRGSKDNVTVVIVDLKTTPPPGPSGPASGTPGSGGGVSGSPKPRGGSGGGNAAGTSSSAPAAGTSPPSSVEPAAAAPSPVVSGFSGVAVVGFSGFSEAAVTSAAVAGLLPPQLGVVREDSAEGRPDGVSPFDDGATPTGDYQTHGNLASTPLGDPTYMFGPGGAIPLYQADSLDAGPTGQGCGLDGIEE
ncbi:hypothetical protein FOA52_003302 [Chlamydomonas sp. UWO 241]|nr:hypothetical protein FOA52_003302 [Chlamydomonas sp. UWO 241]